MDPEIAKGLAEVINETYTDEIDEILNCRIEENGNILVVARDGKKQLAVLITATKIQIKLLNPGAVASENPAFSEAIEDDGDIVDSYAAATEAVGPAIDSWVGKIAELLGGSNDLVDFAEKLEQVYPGLDGARVTGIMQDAFLASNLAGAEGL